MAFETKKLSDEEVYELFKIEEDHFNDYKAKDISGKGISKIISAFCNASGGDVYIGIREENDTKNKHWEGFNNIEEMNSIIQVIESLKGLSGNYDIEFMLYSVLNTYVLHITVFKTQEIVYTTDSRIYVRKGAQSLPVDTDEKIRRLELDKGITSYEDQTIATSEASDVIASDIFDLYFKNNIPKAVPNEWLKKQRLLINNHLTVAAELLFCDEPQITLPKRSSIKIFRYKTSESADRDTLAGQM